VRLLVAQVLYGFGASGSGDAGKGLWGLGKSAPIQIREIEDWLRAKCQPAPLRLAADEERLILAATAAEEDLQVEILGEAVLFSARTSSAGPGYHHWVCETLRRMGKELNFNWLPEDAEYFDETGYWGSGDWERLQGEMRGWLRTLGQTVLEQPRDFEETAAAICMPLEAMYARLDATHTQLGPRGIDWWRDVIETGDGSDFWVWRGKEIDAAQYVAEAKVSMWCDVRWRVPMDEAEMALFRRIDGLLYMARRLSPSIEVPAREWVEIIGYGSGRPSPQLVAEAARQTGPLIGYLRSPYTYIVSPTWSVVLDGGMVTKWMPAGDFQAHDDHSFVGVRPLRLTGPDAMKIPAPQGEVVELPDARLDGTAYLEWLPEGTPCWRLIAYLKSGDRGATVVIVRSEEMGGRDWIRERFKTLKFVPPKAA